MYHQNYTERPWELYGTVKKLVAQPYWNIEKNITEYNKQTFLLQNYKRYKKT